MALIRMRAVVDAAMRTGLTLGDLPGVADRVLMGESTVLDTDLMAALGSGDLDTIGMTAAMFIVAYAAPFRAVAAIMRTKLTDTCTVMFKHATDSMRTVAMILRDRLQVLPDAADRYAIGERFIGGHLTVDDIAVIRALPGPYLRCIAAVDHWRVFADYRELDPA